jgi:translation initiation factor IF-2
MSNKDKENKAIVRPPIVGVLGHVDHGKTTLLDALRDTSIQSREAGGITQNISWSILEHEGEEITLIDTPGHQAFSVMREVGGTIADVVLLIVAADEGVQPQTKEAINIVNETGSELIVVITKMDKEGANPDKVKTELAENEVMVEGWGGQVPVVETSATEREGLDDLLEMINLVAEMKELKVMDTDFGLGIILDSWKDKSRGNCIDVIITRGNFKRKYSIESEAGVDRASVVQDSHGQTVDEVQEGYGVRMTALDHKHITGSLIYCAPEENQLKEAKKLFKNIEYVEREITSNISEEEQEVESLEDLFAKDDREVFNLIIKSDTQGSLDALIKEIESVKEKYGEEVNIKILSSGIGDIKINDVEQVLGTDNSLIVGFNVEVNRSAINKAKSLNVEPFTSNVIYDLVEKIDEEVEKLVKPKKAKKILGQAKVKQVFELSNGSIVGGSIVASGKIQKGAKCEVIRNKKIVARSKISSLKIQKKSVDEVPSNTECGIGLQDKVDLKDGDILRTYEIIEK